MSTPEVRPSESASDLNAATDRSRSERAAGIRTETAPKTAPKTARKAPKTAAKTAPKVAPKVAPAPAPTGRKALSPAERAARPATATIEAYADYLSREVFSGKVASDLPGVTGPNRKFGKLSARERAIAKIAITLYGSYQISAERRKARLG
jgi:hypothetical protein